MRIRCGYLVEYDCPVATPMMLMLSVRPEREADLVTPQVLLTRPDVPLHSYLDAFGNRCTRLLAPAGRLTLTSDFMITDSGLPDPVEAEAVQHPVDALPDEVIVYLLASRYCETDVMADLAWSLFGHVEPGWGRVQAIVDYVHQRLTFGYPHSRSTRTAWEGHQEQVGVCRDFAHLAITLCRCMNIPARYCTGYLGDIGVPLVDAAMDFSAWFQVFLGGEWRTFDARHNRPRVGRILMAWGRDAVDVAIATTFGPAELSHFTVITEEIGSA